MANKTEEFLERIREIDGLKNAIISGITVLKRERIAEFFLVTDKTYTQEEEITAREVCEKYLPSGFSAKVKIVKRVPDKTLLKNRIYEYIQIGRAHV